MVILILRLLFCLLFLGSVPARAGEPIVCAVIDIGPPSGYRDPGSRKLKGIYYDISRAIEKESGLRFEYRLLPYKRMIVNLQSGDVDFSIFTSAERKKTFIQVGLVQHRPVGVVALKGRTLTDYDDLGRLRIGVMRGGKYDDRFDKDGKLKKYEVKDYTIGMAMLGKQRIDALAGSLLNIYYKARASGIEPGPNFIFKKKQAWMQFSKKSSRKQHVPALRQALAKLYKKDQFIPLHEQYLPDYRKMVKVTQHQPRNPILKMAEN